MGALIPAEGRVCPDGRLKMSLLHVVIHLRIHQILSAAADRSFAATVQFENLKYMQYSCVFKLSFATKFFVIRVCQNAGGCLIRQS